jgi:hypothetical protein
MKYLKLFENFNESNSPERNVVDSETGELVGTHKYGVGFKPNRKGEEMGHKEHPTSIPNHTRFDDEWSEELEDEDEEPSNQ